MFLNKLFYVLFFVSLMMSDAPVRAMITDGDEHENLPTTPVLRIDEWCLFGGVVPTFYEHRRRVHEEMNRVPDNLKSSITSVLNPLLADDLKADELISMISILKSLSKVDVESLSMLINDIQQDATFQTQTKRHLYQIGGSHFSEATKRKGECFYLRPLLMALAKVASIHRQDILQRSFKYLGTEDRPLPDPRNIAFVVESLSALESDTKRDEIESYAAHLEHESEPDRIDSPLKLDVFGHFAVATVVPTERRTQITADILRYLIQPREINFPPRQLKVLAGLFMNHPESEARRKLSTEICKLFSQYGECQDRMEILTRLMSTDPLCHFPVLNKVNVLYEMDQEACRRKYQRPEGNHRGLESYVRRSGAKDRLLPLMDVLAGYSDDKFKQLLPQVVNFRNELEVREFQAEIGRFGMLVYFSVLHSKAEASYLQAFKHPDLICATEEFANFVSFCFPS